MQSYLEQSSTKSLLSRWFPISDRRWNIRKKKKNHFLANLATWKVFFSSFTAQCRTIVDINNSYGRPLGSVFRFMETIFSIKLSDIIYQASHGRYEVILSAECLAMCPAHCHFNHETTTWMIFSGKELYKLVSSTLTGLYVASND